MFRVNCTQLSWYLYFFRGTYVCFFFFFGNVCAPRIDQTDHDLDHLSPHLPLWSYVQDLHSTDPTQETCPRTSCRLYGSRPGNIQLDHTDQESICPARQIMNCAGDRSKPWGGDRWSVRGANGCLWVIDVVEAHRDACCRMANWIATYSPIVRAVNRLVSPPPDQAPKIFASRPADPRRRVILALFIGWASLLVTAMVGWWREPTNCLLKSLYWRKTHSEVRTRQRDTKTKKSAELPYATNWNTYR